MSSSDKFDLHKLGCFNSHDMCKIMTWSDHYFTNKSNMNFPKVWFMTSQTICEIVSMFQKDFAQGPLLPK